MPLRGDPAKGVGAYLLANSAVGGVTPSKYKTIIQRFFRGNTAGIIEKIAVSRAYHFFIHVSFKNGVKDDGFEEGVHGGILYCTGP